MIQIANPIYDAVFRYLMNDNQAAKILLSTIIGEEIVELDFRPTEMSIPLQDSITVYRIDFSALILQKDGTNKLIIIEIQKAKLHTDIMRFRRYLGNQYMDENNSKVTKVTKAKVVYRKAYPILSIYFLGHPLENLANIPVIKVARQYYNLSTGEIIDQKEEFIESLTHDSYIIQIPFIPAHHSNELEQLLSIFDQNQITNDEHILNFKEDDLPRRFRPVLRKLLEAIADDKIRQHMQAEDDIIWEFQTYSRRIAEQEQIIEEREQIIEEKDQAIEEKDQAIEEKDQAIEEKDQAIEEKDQAIANSVLEFDKLNLPAEKIAEILNLSLEQVKVILLK